MTASDMTIRTDEQVDLTVLMASRNSSRCPARINEPTR